jgi:uncharacterized membrane protein
MYQFLLQWLYLIIIIPAIFSSAIDTWKPQETDNQPVVNWLIQTLRFYILYLAFNIVCLWAQYAADNFGVVCWVGVTGHSGPEAGFGHESAKIGRVCPGVDVCALCALH